jgi:hypothetical protein
MVVVGFSGMCSALNSGGGGVWVGDACDSFFFFWFFFLRLKE